MVAFADRRGSDILVSGSNVGIETTPPFGKCT
jgi:hypothetical protein